jgi:signal transduction histidine kinase
MNPRRMHLRTKVVALLVSLAALWGFAAFVTVREGLNLLWVQTYASEVTSPGERLLTELQRERRLSVAYLAKPSGQEREALGAQRQQTDSAAAEFEKKAQSRRLKLAAGSELEQRIDAEIRALHALADARVSIDAGRTQRLAAAQAFTDVVDALFRVYDSFESINDNEIAEQVTTFIQLHRGNEILSREDALVAGALAEGKFTGSEYAQFVQLVGTQRFLRAEAAVKLPDADAARYGALLKGPQFTRFVALEDRLVQGGQNAVKSIAPSEWQAAATPALAGLNEVVVAGGDDVEKRATPVAIWVLVRLLLAAGLGLLAVVASIILSITTARALVRQLERLRAAAWDLATRRLPGVVERLSHGEKVDVAAEAPPLEFGADEIGQLGRAFNAVQQTAVHVAVEQAELRRSVRELFLGLARRNQALVHRQLKLLDLIERRETDPEELSDLFRVDHLATRMRRNAENLIVLSGSAAGRRWRSPVPMVDVVRGAVAEVEDYTRVTVLPIEAASLAGRAVGDVIHLLAELVENAASFSPPYTMVHVGGQRVANGFVVEVEDRGLGMNEAELVAANELLRSPPPEFNLSSTARMGLFVVGQLAERHGIRVEVRRSPYGGTTAIVLIPTDLIVTSESAAVRRGLTEADASEADSLDGQPAAATAPGETAGQPAEDEADGADQPALPSAATFPTESQVRPPHPGTLEGLAERPFPLPRRTSGPQLRPAAQPDTEVELARAELPEEPAGSASRLNTAEYPLVGPPPVNSRPPIEVRPAPEEQSGQPQEPSAPGEFTEVGLPVRVRQASLAAPLREGPPPDPSSGAPTSTRTPEEIRAMMASYQEKTLRGRAEATASPVRDPEPPAGPRQSAGQPAETVTPPEDGADSAQHRPA